MSTNNSWNNQVLAANILFNGGTFSVGTDNTTNAIIIGAGNIGRSIEIGFSTASHLIRIGVANGTTGVDIESGSGGATLNSVGGTVNVQGSTGTNINSSSTINIGNNADSQPINIGTSASSRPITIGNTTGTTGVQFKAGSSGLQIPAFAEGSLITDSTGVISTVTGTAGFVLTANAPGTAPSFQAASGGGTGIGNKVLIQTQTATNSTSLDFITGLSGYAYLFVEILNIIPATNGAAFELQFSTNSGSSWENTNYDFGGAAEDVGGAVGQYTITSNDSFWITRGTSNSTTTWGTNSTLYIYNIDSSSAYKQVFYDTSANNGAGVTWISANGSWNNTAVVNGLRFIMSAGNITSGTIRVYGILQSGGGGAVTGPTPSTDRAIATWNGVGGNVLFNNSTTKIDSSGIFTNTGQPCFLTYLNASVSNVTGNGTNYQIAFDAIGFDQTSSIAAGIFTAPVSGRYFFSAAVAVSNLGAAHTTGYMLIVKNSFAEFSANPYLNPFAVSAAAPLGYMGMNSTQIFQLAASDTVSVYINVTGSTQTVGINGNGGTLGNGYPCEFSGYLIC